MMSYARSVLYVSVAIFVLGICSVCVCVLAPAHVSHTMSVDVCTGIIYGRAARGPGELISI